jgi:hypothetical protein
MSSPPIERTGRTTSARGVFRAASPVHARGSTWPLTNGLRRPCPNGAIEPVDEHRLRTSRPTPTADEPSHRKPRRHGTTHRRRSRPANPRNAWQADPATMQTPRPPTHHASSDAPTAAPRSGQAPRSHQPRHWRRRRDRSRALLPAPRQDFCCTSLRWRLGRTAYGRASRCGQWVSGRHVAPNRFRSLRRLSTREPPHHRCAKSTRFASDQRRVDD